MEMEAEEERVATSIPAPRQRQYRRGVQKHRISVRTVVWGNDPGTLGRAQEFFARIMLGLWEDTDGITMQETGTER